MRTLKLPPVSCNPPNTGFPYFGFAGACGLVFDAVCNARAAAMNELMCWAASAPVKSFAVNSLTSL